MSLSTGENRRSFLVSDMENRDDVPDEITEVESRELVNQEAETPVRHLHIDWSNSSIKGVFAIGAAVPDMRPPLYDMPLPDVVNNNAASAVFRTRTSPINVSVQVLHCRGQDASTPDPNPSASALSNATRRNTVLINAKSWRNSVCVHVPTYYGRKPLHLVAETHAGNGTLYLAVALTPVTVVLPRSFNGMLRWRVDAGLFTMSSGLAEHAKRLDAEPFKHHGTHQIYASESLPGWMTGNNRRGDVCEIYTHAGRIFVCQCGENKKVTKENCVIC